jgi:hypothetical protein
MPQLIRNIEGNDLTYVESNVYYVTYITGEIQREDYINLHGYNAYLQNLIQTDYTEAMTMPLNYGLKNPQNIATITLQIDY